MPQVAAALAPIAINLAIGVGAAVLGNLIRPQQQAQTQTVTTSRGLTFNLTVGESVPVSTLFGLARTGGHLIFAQEYGTNNEYLKLVITMGKGRFDGLQQFLVEEKPATLSGSNDGVDGMVVDPYTVEGTPYMWIKTYDGRPGQAADPGLMAVSGARWGSLHRCTGTPYVVITMRFQADKYVTNSLPRFGFVWRGQRLYDWRKDSTVLGGSGLQRWGQPDTYTWSENVAVILYNWRRGLWIGSTKFMGQGFSAYSNDLAYFTAAANRCDEPIYFPESDISLPCYTYGREVTDDEEHLSVIQEMESAMCGSSFERGGAYAPLPASQQIPVMTLEDKHLVDGETRRLNKWGSVSSKKSRVHGTFVSQADYFVPTSYATRINLDIEALINGKHQQPFNQPFEYRQERAQMRAEINLRRNLFPATLEATYGPSAAALEAGDPVTVNTQEWGPMLMIIESVAPNSDETGSTFTFSQWDNSIVPSSGESFVAIPPGPGAGPADPDRTILVPNFNAIAVQQSGGGAVHPMARATWTFITDPKVTQVMVRVWPAEGAEATDALTVFANARVQTAQLIGPLQPLTAYKAKALVVRSDGKTPIWTAEKTFTTGEESTPAEVADNTITIDKLVQEIRNRVDQITNEIPERILQLEAEMAQQADNSMSQAADSKKLTNTLVARMGSAISAVLQEKITRAEVDSAMAIALTQVLAQVDNLFASGSIRFESRVSIGGAEATIALMVRVGMDDDYADSGIFIKATRDGAGGTLTEILFLAEKLSITDGVNTANAFSFDAASGSLVLKSLRVESIKSIDGITIDIDGIAGGFSVTVP